MSKIVKVLRGDKRDNPSHGRSRTKTVLTVENSTDTVLDSETNLEVTVPTLVVRTYRESDAEAILTNTANHLSDNVQSVQTMEFDKDRAVELMKELLEFIHPSANE